MRIGPHCLPAGELGFLRSSGGAGWQFRSHVHCARLADGLAFGNARWQGLPGLSSTAPLPVASPKAGLFQRFLEVTTLRLNGCIPIWRASPACAGPRPQTAPAPRRPAPAARSAARRPARRPRRAARRRGRQPLPGRIGWCPEGIAAAPPPLSCHRRSRLVGRDQREEATGL